MANIVPLDNISLPSYLQNRKALNTVFSAGLPQSGGFPMIGLSGTRFVIKNEGTETFLPSLEISVVLLSAKETKDKTYYVTKYDPNQSETRSPDCFSRDGERPDPSSPLKQAESCAGCPMNQFGSGTGADGKPSKGKACADSKMLAIFANGGVYGFKVPPASLKALSNYVRETSRHNVDLSTAITVIGFDPQYSFAVLTFQFGGFLAEQQIAKLDPLKDSDEVREICGQQQVKTQQTLLPPAPAPAPPVIPAPEPVQFELFAEEPPKKTRKASTPAPAPAPAPSVDPSEDALSELLGI